MTLKGNFQTHCKRGHEMVPENIYYSPDGNARHCRTCKQERAKLNARPYDPIKMRQWRKEWRERNPLYHKKHWLNRAYKLSLEEFDKMVKDRNNKCYICREDMEKPCVDHNHNCCPDMHKTCGKCIRGLLCAGCNLLLGRLKDDVVKLERAIVYLKKEVSKCHH
jgi:Recombination endonuclease VII